MFESVKHLASKKKSTVKKNDREFRRQEFLWLGQSFGLTKDWWPLKTDSLRNRSVHFAPEFLSVAASFGNYMLLQSSAMTKLEPPGQGLGVVSHTHTHVPAIQTNNEIWTRVGLQRLEKICHIIIIKFEYRFKEKQQYTYTINKL